MPTYEYKREDGTVFEITQSIKDDPLTECPETGQKVRRLISKNNTGTIIRGWSPDKEKRKKEYREKNPYGTTLPEYQKKIDENTEKAREIKAKKGIKHG